MRPKHRLSGAAIHLTPNVVLPTPSKPHDRLCLMRPHVEDSGGFAEVLDDDLEEPVVDLGTFGRGDPLTGPYRVTVPIDGHGVALLIFQAGVEGPHFVPAESIFRAGSAQDFQGDRLATLGSGTGPVVDEAFGVADIA
jgi:hypothetical protein